MSLSLSLSLCGSFIACAHAQQLIWQLFNAVEKGFNASGDTDTAFLEGESQFRMIAIFFFVLNLMTEVQTKRAQMDKGIRIGWWGQLQGRVQILLLCITLSMSF